MKTLPDRVEDVVVAWSGIQTFLTKTPLSVLWGKSAQGATVPFPQAASILIEMLQTEFRPPAPDARDLSDLNPQSFGKTDTVDDLVDKVLWAPRPTEAHAFIMGFAHPKAQTDFVNAIADEVVKRLATPAVRKAKKTAARKHVVRRPAKKGKVG